MSTLTTIIEAECQLAPADVSWLGTLTADWQIIADLAFADLVLWVPTKQGGYVAGAVCRPSSGDTLYYEDLAGTMASDGRAAEFDTVRREGSIRRFHESRTPGAAAVREEIVPVTRRGQAIAVLTRQTNLGATRTPSRLELNYVEIANELIVMVSRGEFPSAGAPVSPHRDVARVGDGLVRLNPEGEVLYASPNAHSVFHRFGTQGELVGRMLVDVIVGFIPDGGVVDESLAVVAMGKAPWRTEVESNGAWLSLRAIPLTDRGIRIGAVLLCRDVTDVRRRELELMTKDATIREIHHRVKNNLQNVAALLRLQARRSQVSEVKAALGEAMRRVETIATVHDMLSQTLDETVDFDEVFGRSLRLVADVASAGASVRTVREGAFGQVPAQDATVLALVLTELVTNAVEHGLAPAGGGTVWVSSKRKDTQLRVVIADDGVGMSDADPVLSGGLGTQIVRTFVTGELHGSIEWKARKGGGTRVIVKVKLH